MKLQLPSVCVLVQTDDGDSWSARINATFTGACQYYLGQIFYRMEGQPFTPSFQEVPRRVVAVTLLEG